MKFKIRYALGGGFGGCENMEWEEIEAEDLDEANDIAYENACDEYESYAGMHGIRDIPEIMEEEGVDEEEAQDVFMEDRESWIEYEAEEIKNET